MLTDTLFSHAWYGCRVDSLLYGQFLIYFDMGYQDGLGIASAPKQTCFA